MTKPAQDYARLAAFVVVSVAVVFAASYLKPAPAPPTVNALVDSLAQFRAYDSITIHNLRERALVAVARSELAARQAATAKRSADSIGTVADSLALAAANGADSATAWHQAYAARTGEAIALRVSLTQVTVSRDSAISAAEARLAALEVSEDRRLAFERLNEGLQKQMAGMVPKCRIGPVGCPDRRMVAIGSLLVGVVLTAGR